MIKRNKTTSNRESDVIPAEQVILQQKQILAAIGQVREESERKIRLLGEYQENPLEVVSLEKVLKAIDSLKNPNLEKSVRAQADAVAGLISSVTTLTGREKDLAAYTKELGGLVNDFLHPKAPPEPQGMEKCLSMLKDLLSPRNLMIGTTIIFLIGIILNVVICFDARYQSEDAWAKRAYEAATYIGWKSPGKAYEMVRKSFLEETPETAKGIVRDLENQAAKKMKAEKGDG